MTRALPVINRTYLDQADENTSEYIHEAGLNKEVVELISKSKKEPDFDRIRTSGVGGISLERIDENPSKTNFKSSGCIKNSKDLPTISFSDQPSNFSTAGLIDSIKPSKLVVNMISLALSTKDLYRDSDFDISVNDS